MNKRIRKKKQKQARGQKIILRPDTYTREGWASGVTWSTVPGRSVLSVYDPKSKQTSSFQIG